MAIGKAFPHVHTNTINNTRVGIHIVYNYIMPGNECFNRGKHSLITKIQQIRRFFLYKISKFFFQLQVLVGFSRHRTSAHWVKHSIFCCSFCICF